MRLLLLSLLFLSGCGWSFPLLPKPPERHFSQAESRTITTEPRYVVIEGKVYPVVDKVTVVEDYQVGLDQKQPTIPAWRRAINAVFGWSFLGGLLIFGLSALGIPAVPMLVMAFRRIRASNKHLTQIVSGVNNGLASLPDDQQEKFKAELSKTYDSDTKKAVVLIKGGQNV